MITSMLQTDSSRSGDFALHFAKLLSKINYSKLSSMITWCELEPSTAHTVVLMDYVCSQSNVTIAEMERLPGTVMFIESFIQRSETMSALKALFVTGPNMLIYTRRKVTYNADGSTELTKYKELVLKVLPSAPSPILNPEDAYDEDVDVLDL